MCYRGIPSVVFPVQRATASLAPISDLGNGSVSSGVHLPAAFCPFLRPPPHLPVHHFVHIYSVIIALAQGRTQTYHGRAQKVMALTFCQYHVWVRPGPQWTFALRAPGEARHPDALPRRAGDRSPRTSLQHGGAGLLPPRLLTAGPGKWEGGRKTNLGARPISGA